ncbi:MAG: winged helix-turn-helix domain-containing protein [Candidatus Bathyarchaeia archaeon]
MERYTVKLCIPLLKENSSFRLHRKYRSYIEIIALMLEAMRENGASKFFIMKHANTNSAQLNKYLKTLIHMGFVEATLKNNRFLYIASKKGLAFLKQYYILQEMLLEASAENKQQILTYGKQAERQAEYRSISRF